MKEIILLCEQQTCLFSYKLPTASTTLVIEKAHYKKQIIKGS